MLYYYAVRLTHAYLDVGKRIINAWATKVQKIAVFEHYGEGDTDRTSPVQKTHIHVLLYGCSVAKKQLRNIAQTATNADAVRGNESMAFKEWESSDYQLVIPRAGVYATKGKHDAKYLQGYTIDDVNKWKAEWVAPQQYVKNIVSPSELIYNQFVEEIGPNEDVLGYLKTKCKKFVHARCRIWDQKAMNMYKMLMRSYIFDYKISIPEDETAWKW